MPTAKRYLMIALSFVIALTALTILAPRTVHAVTAALVQVVNTSANPVPQADAATRFQAAMCIQSGTISTAYNPCPAPTNTVSFAVPTTTSTGATVRRLVVENVSGYCSNFGNNAAIIKWVRLRGGYVPDSVSNGNTTFTHYIPVGPAYAYTNDATWGAPVANQAENDYSFGQTSKFTFDPGDTVTFETELFLPSLNGAQDFYCVGRVEGYLVTN